jgi:hypothetical protein
VEGTGLAVAGSRWKLFRGGGSESKRRPDAGAKVCTQRKIREIEKSYEGTHATKAAGRAAVVVVSNRVKDVGGLDRRRLYLPVNNPERAVTGPGSDTSPNQRFSCLYH